MLSAKKLLTGQTTFDVERSTFYCRCSNCEYTNVLELRSLRIPKSSFGP